MMNIKEKTMKFMEEFYVYEHVCGAMIAVDGIQDFGLLGPHLASYQPYFKDAKWLFDYGI